MLKLMDKKSSKEYNDKKNEIEKVKNDIMVLNNELNEQEINLKQSEEDYNKIEN